MATSLTTPVRKDQKLYTNNLLFIIPSWHLALGAPLGTYANRPVTAIQADPVVFFAGKEAAVETSKGTAYYLFGVGYYSLKFQMEGTDQYVVDHRPLTGLVLGDFLYDTLATSRPLALEEEPDICLAANVLRAPIDLSHKSEQKLTFIKGILTRYLFTSYKDTLLEMVEQIRNPDAFVLSKWGHLLLSTTWDNYNTLLVSHKIGGGMMDSYLQPTAGLAAVKHGADEHLLQTFSEGNLGEIASCIQSFKTTFSQVRFDSVNLYTMLQGAAAILKALSPAPPMTAEQLAAGSRLKDSLLISAEPRANVIAEWPADIPRLAAEKVAPAEPDFKQVVHQFHQKMSEVSGLDPSQATATLVDKEQRESFQLRQMARAAVEKKALPAPPQGDLEEIFLYIKYILDENFDMPTVAQAIELARESVRKVSLQSKYIRPMSMYTNRYALKQTGMSLSPREKEELSRDLNAWVEEIQTEKRLERERLERERLEKERQERDRLEKERQIKEHLETKRLEREREEREHAERDRQEKMRKEYEQKERERAERDRLERERHDFDRKMREQEEQARLERERLEKERLAREQEEQIAREQQRLAEERENVKRLAMERKQREKEEKTRLKELKKIEKEKQKVEKQRKKEEEKLKKLKAKD